MGARVSTWAALWLCSRACTVVLGWASVAVQLLAEGPWQIGRNDRLGPGKGEGALSPESGSFLGVEPAHASLFTWKKAEDGRGTVVRLVEVGGRDGTARVASPWLRRGWVERVTAVEDPEPRRRHDRALRPFGIETFRAR